MTRSSRVSVIMLPLLSLLVTGCAMPKMPDIMGKKEDSEQQLNASREGQCTSQAKERLALFDRPDTYPVSEDEKRNAYQALYTQCLKSFEVTAATPKPNFDVAANQNLDLANLSPAAGGAPKPANAGAVTYSNGMMIIDTSKLTGLSPAAGAPAGTAVASQGPNNSTVVVVQAPPTSTTVNYPPMPAPTSPAAIPTGGIIAAQPAPAAETWCCCPGTKPSPSKKSACRRHCRP